MSNTFKHSRLIVVCIFCIIVSCNPRVEQIADDPSSPFPGQSENETAPWLVDAYYRLNNLSTLQESYTFVTNSSGKNFLALWIKYNTTILSQDEWEEYIQETGESKHRFAHYTESDGGTHALAHKIDRIEIVSNNDFNDIPAGSSLTSKFLFLSASAWPVIQVGRVIRLNKEEDRANTVFGQYFGYYYFNLSFTPVQGLLSELAPESLYLLEYDTFHAPAVLLTEEIPEIKTHIFTVTYYEGEKEWRVDFPVNFK